MELIGRRMFSLMLERQRMMMGHHIDNHLGQLGQQLELVVVVVVASIVAKKNQNDEVRKIRNLSFQRIMKSFE